MHKKLMGLLVVAAIAFMSSSVCYQLWNKDGKVQASPGPSFTFSSVDDTGDVVTFRCDPYTGSTRDNGEAYMDVVQQAAHWAKHHRPGRGFRHQGGTGGGMTPEQPLVVTVTLYFE